MIASGSLKLEALQKDLILIQSWEASPKQVEGQAEVNIGNP